MSRRLIAPLMLALSLLAVPVAAAVACCSDEACCKAGCVHCKH
jgi:hypothetical protein